MANPSTPQFLGKTLAHPPLTSLLTSNEMDSSEIRPPREINPSINPFFRREWRVVQLIPVLTTELSTGR